MAEELHKFLIADWRSQPDCHICHKGAAYYQCRLCERGVHPECRPLTQRILRPNDGHHCATAGCPHPADVLMLTGHSGIHMCDGCLTALTRRLCVPVESEQLDDIIDVYISIQEGTAGGEELPEWYELPRRRRESIADYVDRARAQRPDASIHDLLTHRLTAAGLI